MAATKRSAFLAAALSLAIGALAEAAPDPGVERIWTGTNGSSFRGMYVESIAQGGKIRFLTTDGKVVTVAFGNLSEADQKIIEGFEGKDTGGAGTRKPDFDPDKFKELPVADRNLIPERKAADFGGNDSDSMVDALWVSLLWWNAFEVMPIPKTGDFDRKAAWLHEELTRYIAPGGRRAATLPDAKEGIEKYFSRRLEDTGACRVKVIGDESLTPDGLSQLVGGNDIIILRLEMVYKNGKEYVECAALEKFDAQGNFSMQMYGKRQSGKMVLLPEIKSKYGQPGEKIYEFVMNVPSALPENYIAEEPRFFVNRFGWSGGLVIKPYVFKTVGEPAPLPKD